MDEQESRLVELVLSGRAEAFEALVGPYRSPLLGLAQRLTGDIEDAKEACQEALFRAFRYLHTFDRRKNFKSWLFGILVNSSRTLTKKRRRGEGLVTGLSENVPGGRDDPARLRTDQEFRSRLRECLAILTGREREVFLLRDLEERTVRETAGILHCSTTSVRVHLCAARKKLRARLNRTELGPGEGSS